MVCRDMFPRILLREVSDLEGCVLHPPCDESIGAVGRAIIYDQPLEILERLCSQAIVDTRKECGSVVGRREYGE